MSATDGNLQADDPSQDSDAPGVIVPRDGSSLYYALLWTPVDARTRLLDRLSLVRTLSTTLDEVSDPGVAERKVHWWHEELERLKQGSPRHPSTVACASSLSDNPAAASALLDVLSVAATTRYTPPPTDEEWQARLTRDFGARLALLAHALSNDSEDLSAPGIRHDSLATGLGLHEGLSRLPALLHRGHAVFSEEAYARHQLNPAALAREIRQDKARRENQLSGIPIVTEEADRHGIVRDTVDTAMAALQRAISDRNYRQSFSRPALAPLVRLVALRSRQLALWQARQPDLLRERMTPTPLTKFYIAWRHRNGPRN